jgi:hypothetical protein
MPTIKLNAEGKVITKGGKPSCTCCCVCDFYIYGEYVADDNYLIYIVNNSTCPLEVEGFSADLGLDNPVYTPAGPQTVDGSSTLVIDLTDSGNDIRGLFLLAFTSCGEFSFSLPD